MRLKSMVAILYLIIAGCGSAEQAKISTSFDPGYKIYATVLAKSVNGEAIDYKQLKENRLSLDTVVAQFSALSSEAYARMTTSESMTFWINAYNAITLRSIIDAYPVQSIRDIKGVWKEKQWNVAGRIVTLDEIEHSILRPDYKDPRVHFAVNCASVGCPPLLPVPFKPEQLDSQLHEVSAQFVNHLTRNKIDINRATISTTQIFEWFGDDFIALYGGDQQFSYLEKKDAAIMNFIYTYANETNANLLSSYEKWSLEYYDYDWSLNDIER